MLENFQHRTVCHKHNLVDPRNSVYTQNTEAFWSVFKRRMRRRGYNLDPFKNLTTYTIEFLYIRKIDIFEDFFTCLNKYWNNQ